MLHPLQWQIRRIARRARLLVLIRGAACFLAITFIAALIAGGLDYGLRLQDIVLRSLVTAAAAGACAWALLHYLWPVLGYHCDEVTVARWIERGRPELNDELSSAIAFLRSPADDVTAGSPSLRTAHIQRVQSRLAERPLTGCLRVQDSLRPLLISGLIAAVLGAAYLADPASAQIAALRLISPWNDLNWPRRNQLTLLNPITRLAAGQDFEAVVIDKNDNLPANVTIHYWPDGAATDAAEQVSMKYAGGRMFHRLTNVTRGFQYRVTGGDDQSMGWLKVTVVQPPQIEATSVHVTPPSYTGWKEYETAGPIRALKGSRVEIETTFSQPIDKATLRTDPPTAMPGATAGEMYCVVDESGLELQAGKEKEWFISESGKYWMEVTTRDDLNITTRSWEIQSSKDEPPVLGLAHAAAGGIVSARAHLPLTITVKDDIAIHSIEVRVIAAELAEPLVVMPIWEGPQAIEPATLPPQPASDERRVTATVDLASLGLEPGQNIEIIAAAMDYKPQEGTSPSQQLRVVDERDLEDRLLELQTRLIATVDDAVRQQRETRGQTVTLELHFEEGKELQPRDADVLKGIDLHQRQINQMLVGDAESALAQSQAIVSEIQLNQLPMPAVEQQLLSVIDTLRGWQALDVPTLERSVLAAMKRISSDLEKSPAVSESLRQDVSQTASQQKDFLRKLEQLAARLAEWEGFRRFAGEVRQLARDQQRLLDELSALQPKTLGQEIAQLPAEARTELRRSSQQQMDLVRRFEDLAGRMSVAQSDATDEPPVAEALRRALEIIERRAIAVDMRESADQSQRNTLSDSTAAQRRAAESLAELLDALTGRQSTADEQQPNAMAASAEALSKLQQQQQDIDQRRAALAADPTSATDDQARQQLADDQRKLADQVAELARSLQQLSPEASAALQQAAESMSEAADQVQQNDFPSAEEAASEAKAALDQAATSLANGMQAQQQNAANQLKAELLERLQQFHQAQVELQQRTKDIDAQRDEQNLLDVDAEMSARSLGGDQQALAVNVKQLSQRSATWSLYEHLLAQTSTDMEGASARLLQADSSSGTQELQYRAIERIEQMLAALEREGSANSDPGDSDSDGDNSGEEAPSNAPSNEGPRVSIEELELLQIMQANLAERTDALERRHATESSSDAWKAEQRALADEQGRLAELLLKVFSK